VQERLQKILSAAGVVSRRAAEGLIVQGRVAVNGTPVLDLGSKADPQTDTISVDGKKIKTAVPLRYVLVNKPTGMVTTRFDPERRPTVLELIPQALGYLYPVGRLDYDSEGLLLLTNDGELAARLMHPRHEVPKVYRVRVRGVPDADAMERLTRGMPLDGHRTAPAGVRVLKRLDTPRGSDSIVDITLKEGRNRQVRRMFEAVGHPVVTLSRVQFGPLRDPGLKVGHSRELTAREIKELQASAVLTTPATHGKTGLGAPQKRRDGPRTRGAGAPRPNAPQPHAPKSPAPAPAAKGRWTPKPASEPAAKGRWAPKAGAEPPAKAATARPRPRPHARTESAPRPRRPSAGGRPRRG
jgi:23S rRNA pseudouridine2605 synthase